MDILLLIAAFIAGFHFVYEGIILPSIRLTLRNRLFALRDELRALKFGNDSCDEAAFDLVHTGINNYLNRLHLVTISLRVRMRKLYESDADFQKQVEDRRALIEQAHNESLRAIVRKSDRVIGMAFIANSGAYFIYIVPIVFCFTMISRTWSFAKALFALPTNMAARLMPLIDGGSQLHLQAR